VEIRGKGYIKVLQQLLLLDGKRHAYYVGMSERFYLFTFPLLFIMFRIHDRMVFIYDRYLSVNRAAQCLGLGVYKCRAISASI
jgi:hypothetical protein